MKMLIVLQYLMVDVVVNHFAWAGPGTTVDYTQLKPFNDQKYFHDYCLMSDGSYQNETNVLDVCFSLLPTSSPPSKQVIF